MWAVGCVADALLTASRAATHGQVDMGTRCEAEGAAQGRGRRGVGRGHGEAGARGRAGV